jgi:hypothetical protein
VAGLNRALQKVPLPPLRRDLAPPRDPDLADEE